MTNEPEILGPEAEQGRQAMESLRDELPSAAFRERLRRGFVKGTLASPARGAVERDPAVRRTLPTHPGATGRRLVPRPRASGWAGIGLRWGLAATAAIAIATVATGLNAGAPWRVESVSGEGIAVVNQRPIPLNHVEELERALTPGARVRVPPGCDLMIRSRGALAIQMTPETESIVPGVPGRWFGRHVTGEVQSGEWRIVTGPRFSGARLAIATPAARVEVTGTTLAVICEPPGTCVCVYKGRVRVGRPGASMVAIEEGRRRYVFLDPARDMESDIMRPTEAVELERLDGRMRGELGD